MSDQETAEVLHGEASIDVSRLKRFITHLHAVVDEATLEFRESGVHVHAVDPANVCLVHSHLAPSRFEDYDVPDVDVVLDLWAAKSVLEAFEGKVSVTVCEDDQTITFANDQSTYTRTYIDPDTVRDADRDHDWERTTEIYVPSHELRRAVELATETSDAINFEYNADESILTISGSGDRGQAATTIEPQVTPENHDGWGLYTYDYLNDVLEALGNVSVSVGLGDEKPIEFGVLADGIETDYAIAPRIGGDD